MYLEYFLSNTPEAAASNLNSRTRNVYVTKSPTESVVEPVGKNSFTFEFYGGAKVKKLVHILEAKISDPIINVGKLIWFKFEHFSVVPAVILIVTSNGF